MKQTLNTENHNAVVSIFFISLNFIKEGILTNMLRCDSPHLQKARYHQGGKVIQCNCGRPCVFSFNNLFQRKTASRWWTLPSASTRSTKNHRWLHDQPGFQWSRSDKASRWIHLVKVHPSRCAVGSRPYRSCQEWSKITRSRVPIPLLVLEKTFGGRSFFFVEFLLSTLNKILMMRLYPKFYPKMRFYPKFYPKDFTQKNT